LVRAITRLGRGSETDIRVEDPGCSRNHCEIILGQPVLVRDLGSTNGTFVNGVKITESAIEDGGSVSLGSTTLVFRAG
jgi:pSer/pThr/pTyr-binding forkhead associated (FHA) protein